MERYICIHGHFYQPPRENPWLEAVELQDSASPYHDWNERITAECYAPNAAARILDGENRISEITSNYSRISFNFGPTLLAWLQDRMPGVHAAIVAADRLSRERFSGHGSAMAQVYNHMILPLANPRDKATQVLWGIRDFEHRFGRKPEGLWLSETAADMDTLETLAAHEIKFTILSPFQASRVREIGKRSWRDVNGGQVDPTRPYLARLPSGKTIALFFYDGPVSQAVAFEKLLVSGERFAHRLLSAFNDRRQWNQLVHIATDGESYGHHHRHGEMALAYALHHIESNQLARLTNYGEHLEKHPPTHEVQIHEKSAWSCSHGVERWMADCGCNSGGHQGWNQGWRGPLRNSLDWLRDTLAPAYEEAARKLVRDPWTARDDYISVILDRSEDSRTRFLQTHTERELAPHEKTRLWKLLELQRHAMLMYTSCGWFFDELSGIETVQVIQYAARAIQLANEALAPPDGPESIRELEGGFLERLEHARSNIPAHHDGKWIYNHFVKPAMTDPRSAVAHYAISSVFQQYSDRTRVFSFTFEDRKRQALASGKTRLATGIVHFRSEITQEAAEFAYGILYLGEHNLTGGVRQMTPEEYESMEREVKAVFESGDHPETIRLIDRHFGEPSYSLKSLFKDEQRRILNEILASTREDLAGRFRLIVERYEPLMKFLRNAGAPPPPALETVNNFVLHSDIRGQLDANPIDLARLRTLLAEGAARGPAVLDAEIAHAIATRMSELMHELAQSPEDLEKMDFLEEFAAAVMPLPVHLNLAETQDTYWRMVQTTKPILQGEQAQAWTDKVARLGKQLGFNVGWTASSTTREPEAQVAAATS